MMRYLPFLLLTGLALMLMATGEADADEPLPLYGGNWAEVDNEPPEVGDGALGITWNQTDVAIDALSVSIVDQSGGYSPANARIQIGTTVTWTNDDDMTHTVTDKHGAFDTFDIAAGETGSLTFTEIGVFNYYCKYHPMMEGSITVLSSNKVDERARTNYLQVWTAESYLVFWANFNMSDGGSIEVIAEKLVDNYDGTYPLELINLNQHNGFSIVCVSNGTVMGDSLKGNTSGEWKKYQIYLDSEKLGYNNLDYDPHEDNRHRFIFRVRGIEGSAAIGGVQLIRDLDTGFYFGKAEHETLQYDILPSLKVEIDYFAKNIGTEDNTFRMVPELDAQGTAYDGATFYISINVRMNGEAFDSITTFLNDDGIWTHEFDMAPDDEAMITVRFDAPDYNRDTGEPAGNRKFDVVLNAYDTGSDDELRETIQISLFIKPPQFVLGEITFIDRQSIDEIIFNKRAVLTGDSLDITATVWNEGNYASDVLVVFYVIDEDGEAYATPDGIQRLTRVASTTVDLMAPKPVLEDQGQDTWYYATATWDEAFIPSDSSFETVSIYAQINPLLEQQDIDAGLQRIDEYRSNYIEGEGSVCGHCWESIDIAVNPYIENVNIYLNITGDSRMALINATHTSEVTVTIRGPSGIRKFNESYSLGNGQTTSIQFSTDEGELFGEWELLLEPDDTESDFTYDYDWYNHQKSNAAAFGSIAIAKAQSESVNCYVDPGYPISLQSFIFLPYSKPDDPCPEDQVFTSSLIASEDGSGVWTVQIVKITPQVSVNSVHWYLLDVQGNTKTDGLVSDIYGYYFGQGKAVVFIDTDFNGKLSPGDKFEIHPGEAGSELENLADVSGYTFKIRIYAKGEPQEGEKCVDGDTKTAEDGCNQCICNDEEWICTEVACVDDDSDGTIPAVSLITSMAAVAIIALRRRY